MKNYELFENFVETSSKGTLRKNLMRAIEKLFNEVEGLPRQWMEEKTSWNLLLIKFNNWIYFINIFLLFPFTVVFYPNAKRCFLAKEIETPVN